MIQSYLNKIARLVIDVLYAKECLGCGREKSWLCRECLEKIEIRLSDKCGVCHRESAGGRVHEECRAKSNLDGLIVATSFRERAVQDAVHRLKYNFIRELKNPLAEILMRKIEMVMNKEEAIGRAHPLFDKTGILIPVPLHRRRERWRGFNQAELLADEMSKKLGMRVERDILKRVKNTKAQTKLKRGDRLENIRGAVEVRDEEKEKIKAARVWLVDDVATSTATLNECGRALKEAGVQKVWAMVLTRG